MPLMLLFSKGAMQPSVHRTWQGNTEYEEISTCRRNPHRNPGSPESLSGGRTAGMPVMTGARDLEHVLEAARTCQNARLRVIKGGGPHVPAALKLP